MNNAARLLLLAACLILWGRAEARVECAAHPALDILRQPDGALLLRLRSDARLTPLESERGMALVFSHSAPRLRGRTATGQELSLSWHALQGAVAGRSGSLVPLEALRQGLLVREEGSPTPRTPLRTLAAPDPWAARAFLRLEVSHGGMFELRAAWLREQLGHSLATLPDPRNWNLVHNGKVEPVLAEGCEDGSFDEGDRLLFWAEPSRPAVPELGPDSRQDPWCAREIYFLAAGEGPGARLAQESGEIVETNPDLYDFPLTFPDTLLVEEDNHFSRLTYVLDEAHPDHHFWTTGVYGGTLRQVNFHAPGLDAYSTQPVTLRVCMRGLGSPVEEGDPDVVQRQRLYVNNQGGAALEMGNDGQWLNQELRIASFGSEAFPDHSAFREGANTLFIAGVDEAPAGPYSAAMLNWIELRYQRKYEAENGALAFSADPFLHDGRVVNFEVTGFPSSRIQLWKVGRSHVRNAIVRELGGSHRLRFQDSFVAGTRYVAVAEEALATPDAAQDVLHHNLAGITQGAEALVVVADSLMRAGAEEILQPMLEERFGVGGALILSDRWIYDEFSHGKNRPHAIRDLVRRAWSSWAEAPRWLLMIGDGILTPRTTAPGHEPVLPLIYEQVYKWGAASSDDWYARDVGGGALPTLVSRWPAATPEELVNLVAKVGAYEASPGGSWQNSLLFTAGARPPDEGLFMARTEELVQTRLPSRHFVRRIYAGEDGGAYLGGFPQLADLLEQGQLVANYSGHGGGAVWSDNALLNSDLVPQLSNEDRLAFVTNATCFIGSLDYDGALGRALLNSGPMGAIGVLGSTGLGFRDTGMELVAEFMELLLANPLWSVSEVLREAKDRLWLRHVPGREGSEEALRTEAVVVMNVILGLPWQTLRVPAEGGLALENPVASAGDTLRVTGQGALPGGRGRIEIYSGSVRPAQDGVDFVEGVRTVEPVAGPDGSWSATLVMPTALPGGGALGSLRSWMPDTDGNGTSAATWFTNPDSVSTPILWRARLLPDPPRPATPLEVELFVSGPNGPDSLAALLTAQPPAGELDVLRVPMAPQPGDPQRLRGSHAVGPWPDSSLVELRFVQYHGLSTDSTTSSWFWIEAPRPRVDWHVLEDRDPLGRLVLTLQNGGDGPSGQLELTLLSPAGSLLGASTLPPMPPGGEARLPLALPDLPLGDSLVVRAMWDRATGGPWPEDLQVLADMVILRAGQFQWPTPSLQVGLSPSAGERVAALSSLTTQDVELHQSSLNLFSPAYALRWLDGLEPGPVIGSLRLPGLDSLQTEAVELLVWHEESGLFLAQPAGQVERVAGDTLALDFQLPEGRGFVAGHFQDGVPPSLHLEVEGQVFDTGGFVAPGATLSWRVEDPSGVDPRAGSVQVKVNGRELSAQELSLRSESRGHALTIQAELDEELPRGVPIPVELGCRDAAGNVTQSLTSVMVGQSLALRHAGNYPNPFQRDTRFVFSLTGVADKVSIDIYTVAGRRIRRLEALGPLINYNELEWDGRDRNGDVVANGVYFWRLSAQGAEGRVEYMGKTARLK